MKIFKDKSVSSTEVEAVPATGLSRAKCRELLWEMGREPWKDIRRSYKEEEKDNFMHQKLHLEYLCNKGLCILKSDYVDHYTTIDDPIFGRFQNEFSAAEVFPRDHAWFLIWKITPEGISRLEVSKRLGRLPKIDEADDILTIRARAGRRIIHYADELIQVAIRMGIPALLGAAGAALLIK